MTWEWDPGWDVSSYGTISIPAQAARVVLTAVPIGYGHGADATSLSIPAGYVAWDVGTSMVHPINIVWLDQIVKDAPSGVMGLRYYFLPGIAATIYLGYWDPGTALESSRLAPSGVDSAGSGWLVLG